MEQVTQPLYVINKSSISKLKGFFAQCKPLACTIKIVEWNMFRGSIGRVLYVAGPQNDVLGVIGSCLVWQLNANIRHGVLGGEGCFEIYWTH